MKINEDEIIKYIEENFGFGKVVGEPIFPKQGMSSAVFFLEFEDNLEVAVKYGNNVKKDFDFLSLISENKNKVPVPKVFGYFEIGKTQIILLEKINGVLLGEIEKEYLLEYFSEIKNTLDELHKIKKENVNWKEYLLNIFNGKTLDWEEVSKRKLLDGELVKISVENILNKINKLDFPVQKFSLLHTDFNQRNLMVNINEKKIVGVIDWEEATFGDPLYDFARFKLHLWHREVEEKCVQDFLNLLNLNEEEINKMNLYFNIFVLQYLAYYSEKENEFNLSRISKHQDYLVKCKV